MKVSICVPYHDTPKTAFFLSRLLNSIAEQTFTDYEIVLVKKGRMAETYNEAIKQCKGEIIKLMGMDDYFTDKYCLEELVEKFDEGAKWVASGCLHDDGAGKKNPHMPSWNDKLYAGNNTLGGFSVITLLNGDVPKIDETLDWVVDCEWYWRLFQKWGEPTLFKEMNVVIGIGDHQTTNNLSDEQKMREYALVQNKYG
jgi:glycosyltransferase involved in cell wall biosynthesis